MSSASTPLRPGMNPPSRTAANMHRNTLKQRSRSTRIPKSTYLHRMSNASASMRQSPNAKKKPSARK